MLGWRIDLRPFFTEEYTIQQRSRCQKKSVSRMLLMIFSKHSTVNNSYNLDIYWYMLFLIYPGFPTFLPGNCKKPRNGGVSPNLRMVPVIMRFLSFPSSRLVGFWDAELYEAWKTRLVYIHNTMYIYIIIYIYIYTVYILHIYIYTVYILHIYIYCIYIYITYIYAVYILHIYIYTVYNII